MSLSIATTKLNIANNNSTLHTKTTSMYTDENKLKLTDNMDSSDNVSKSNNTRNSQKNISINEFILNSNLNNIQTMTSDEYTNLYNNNKKKILPVNDKK